MPRKTGTAIVLALFCTTAAGQQGELKRDTVWDLKLGQPIAAQPAPEQFRGFACGSNGGPPRRPLSGWSDFKNCAAETSGLHEVYFEYDDEYEYIARARGLDREVARWAGTTEAGFPIVVSALFSDDGVLKGVRIVTDSRPDHRVDVSDADLRTRQDAYLLGRRLAARFGIEPASDCTALPAANGETSVGDLFVKQSCELTNAAAGRKYVLRVNYFRKPGQSGRDPQLPTHLTTGEFESSARLEILQLN